MSYIAVSVAAVSVIGSVATGIMGKSAADRAARRAAQERARMEAEIRSFEASRQAVINPYSGYKNVSGLAKDLSYLANQLSNPYASLGVATNAAKFEAEQIDLSLANTLDILRETGASAGGATALAQAALKAKQGISASLEQQEATNDKLRAQGQAELQQQKLGIQLSEGQRMQGIQMSEEQRMQQAEASGKQFMFQTQEQRDIIKLNRLSGRSDSALNQQMQSEQNSMAAMTGMIGGITTGLGSAAQVYAAQHPSNSTTPPPASDRRLKKNIKPMGVSPNGFKIYSFEYKNGEFGEGVFQGVMSDEVPLEAIVKGTDGYDRVDYSMLDVEFKQIQ